MAVALWVMGACGDYPPIEYVGEHVKVGTYFASPLCAGDIARMDRFVEGLEDDLNAHDSEKIEVFLFDGVQAPNKIPAGCPDDSFGCYVGPFNRVVSSVSSLEHELGHAVAYRVGKADRDLFDEGIPEALTNGRTVFSQTSPFGNRDAQTGDLDRATAAHFMRWLLLEHGPRKFRPLLKGKSFRDAYGISLREASDDYLAAAPWSFPPRTPCDAPPLAPAGEGEWSELIGLDCDADDTRSLTGDILISERSITVTAPGLYNVASTPDSSVWMLGCQLEPLAEEPEESVQPGIWDPREVINEAWSYPDAVPRMMAGGQVHQVLLREGEYLVTAQSLTLEATDVGIEIWPALEG